MGIEAFYYHYHVSQFQISLTLVHNDWMDNKLELVHVIALIWLQTIISMPKTVNALELLQSCIKPSICMMMV